MTTSRAPVVIATVGLFAAATMGYVVFLADRSGPNSLRSGEALNLSEHGTSPSKDLTIAPKSQGPPPARSVDGLASTEMGLPGSGSERSRAAVVTGPTTNGGKAPYQPGPSKFRNATDPRARMVLARVGADLDAETYWVGTINDPTTPAKERADLIEDLNEDGILDPAHPTRKDLPLINSRIALIERLLPSSMDDVNAAAFREAHKDLVKMRDRLQE